MREINSSLITEAVKELCIKANLSVGFDIVDAIKEAQAKESSSIGKNILEDIIRNYDSAKDMSIPICQDTGMAVVFAEIGQNVHITGDNFYEAINKGVEMGYKEGFLRCSVVSDPLNRVNTGNNTPAIIHTSIVEGNKLKLTVSPKGFGSENMSAIRMFNPSATKQDIIDFIVETAKKAGGNPCPPMILGVGIGGDFEYSAILAKKALCRPIDERNKDKLYADMEETALAAVNALNIGPMGFSGKSTALAVNIEYYPTHIAGLPCAVNVGCHVTRHCSVVL